VTLPDYLLTESVAVRKGENEMAYSDRHRWAEPLDRAVRRVVGRNLALLLSTERVSLDAWSRGSVDYEVHLQIDQFEATSAGEVTLVARWQVQVPGEEKPIRTGTLSATRSGPPPAAGMEQTVGVMSSVLGDLSRKLSESLGAANGG